MARFTSGNKVTHNGRPATIAAVVHETLTGQTRYHIFYEDADEVAMSLLGRVLSPRGCQICGWEDYTPICPSCKMDQDDRNDEADAYAG